ncbi:MAG: hypothetical protein LC135_07085 [Phycisphaerae bacterium]|jgi:hypothetical protein|nr:hypothetical protein [Phycisphaerae bacterium]MCZ2399618.1 hypothetical protein [Phycisphaerae bacterium]
MRRLAAPLLWAAAGWLGRRRRPRVAPADVARLDHAAQVRGRGLRLGEWLRDRLRPAWLRVRRDDGGTE